MPSSSAAPTARASMDPVTPCTSALTQQALDSCAQPRRARHLDDSADGREASLVDAAEPIERRQAAGPGDAKRRRAVDRGGDPERAVERGREVHLLADRV